MITINNDKHTIALLHFDTSAIKDECGNTWDASDVTLDNANKKFGSSSLTFSNHSGSVTCGKILNSRYFTFDFWLYLDKSQYNNVGYIFSEKSGYVGWGIYYQQDTGSLCANVGSLGVLGDISSDVWHHVAICMDNDVLYCFIDGKLKSKNEFSNSYINDMSFSGKFKLGKHDSGYSIKGNIDEFRISDVCRWTSNFTPPQKHYVSPNAEGMVIANEPLNLLDKNKVKGFTFEGIEPANTNRRVAFRVDNKWNKLTTKGALSELSTQEITADSILAEGNTVAELTALTNVPSLAGKLVYPAIALYASEKAEVMPTFGMTVKAEIDTTVNVYTKTDYSQEFVLHNKHDVLVKSVTVDSNAKGNGKVTLKARYATFNETAADKTADKSTEQTETWSDYVDILSVINVKCHKLQIKADYQVSVTDGSDSATLNDVIVTYAKDVVAKADGTTDLVTLTEKFTNNLTYVHAYIKHKKLIDADLKAYVRLQRTPKKADFKLIGYGTGERKTYKVTDSGINQDSLMVYVGGKAVYDFDFNTETSEITLVADVDAPINATYEYGWELFSYAEMQKGVSQINDSGAYTTEYSYTIPAHDGEYTVTAIKYELIRPEGKVTNETIGVGTGKRQIIQLPHYARKETIVCNGKWYYDYDSKRLTVIAPEKEPIVISYDWIAESPEVYGIAAGWAD